MMTAFKIRLIMMLMYMAFATWRVFYNVYLEDVGFKGSEIGTLNAILQASILFVVTFWGIIADIKGIRPTLRIVVSIAALAVFGLKFFDNFWILILYIPILSIFYHPLGPLSDALAMQFAETNPKHSYGSFRMWGSFGWAVASIGGGILFAKVSLNNIFLVSAILFTLIIPLLITIKKKRVFRPKFERIQLKEIFSNKPLLLFIGVLLFYGITCSPIFSYINLYFTELNAGNDIIGYSYAIMAFSELPFFIIGNKLLKKIGSNNVIMLAIVSMIIRFSFYGFIPNITLALAIGSLQGISLAFFLVGAVSYLQQLLPAGRNATAQSIIWGAFVGVGQMTGNLFIGFLIDGVGMVGVMKIFIGVASLCLLLAYLYFRKQVSVQANVQ